MVYDINSALGYVSYYPYSVSAVAACCLILNIEVEGCYYLREVESAYRYERLLCAGVDRRIALILLNHDRRLSCHTDYGCGKFCLLCVYRYVYGILCLCGIEGR